MKHSATLTSFAIALLLPLGAVAAEPAAPTQTPAAAQAAAQATAAKAGKDEKSCEKSTASRIRKSNPKDCGKDAQPIRSYSREEIESTGQTDTAEALRRLDPRFH
jgi:hypothetical protein